MSFVRLFSILSVFVFQEHVEGYHELSAKTKIFFSTAVAKWDADFYIKVDDDVHVNLGTFYHFLYLLSDNVYIYIYVLNIALLKCCSIFSYRNASSNSCTPPIKTPCLHWVYEIWTCSFPKVNQISVLVFFIVSFPPLFDGDGKHFFF